MTTITEQLANALREAQTVIIDSRSGYEESEWHDTAANIDERIAAALVAYDALSNLNKG